MSSHTKDSLQHQTTSSGSTGNLSRYNSETPPPAEHISHNQEQVGTRYGWVEIISSERRYRRAWSDCYVLTRCTGCQRTQWTLLANLTRGRSKGCQSCSQLRQIPLWLDRRLTAAKQRCTNPDDQNFKHYGARGIAFNFTSITEAGLWITENLGLHRELELDRIDNNGHYEPGNLRWATRSQQVHNQRRSVMAYWNPAEWPYARSVVTRKLAAGMSRDEILAEAEKAVAERRKNWRGIQARLEFMISPTPDHVTASPSKAA